MRFEPRPRLLRSAFLLAAAAAAFVLAACGGDGADSPKARRTQVEVAVGVPAGSPADRHWNTYVQNVELWAPEFTVTRVARAPAGIATLGQGRVQVMQADLRELVGVLPELAVLERPLLFASDAEADHVLDRVLLPEIQQRLLPLGHRLLGWTEGVARVAYPDATGGAPRIATLDAHAADASAGPAVLIDSGHVPGLILAAPAWYDPLSPHDADVFRMAYALPDARADSRQAVAATLGELAAEGSRAVRAPTPAEFEAWRAAWAPAPTDPASTALLARIEQARADFRAAAR